MAVKFINKDYLTTSLKSFKTVVLNPLFNKKLDNTTDIENAGKAVVVDNEGNLIFGEAGVQVSKEDGNKIETKDDGIYVANNSDAWNGTKAEWDELDKSTLKDGQEVIITDDDDATGVIDDSATRGDATWSSQKISDSLVDLVGDLTELKTTDKSNVVNAINEIKQSGGGGNLKVGTFSGTPNSTGNLATTISQDDIFILCSASKNACVSPFIYSGRWTFHCTGIGGTYAPVTTNLSIEYVYYEL